VAVEIERKFLVKNAEWRKNARCSRFFRQGYLNDENRCSVRVRICGTRAWLNIKSVTVGRQRHEFEFEIPVEEGRAMLQTLGRQPFIEKTRYFVDFSGHTWEIDVFEGDNAGLIVAEIELDHPGQTFVKPPWLGKEVTSDPRYYNTSLSKHPYRNWPEVQAHD